MILIDLIIFSPALIHFSLHRTYHQYNNKQHTKCTPPSSPSSPSRLRLSPPQRSTLPRGLAHTPQAHTSPFAILATRGSSAPETWTFAFPRQASTLSTQRPRQRTRLLARDPPLGSLVCKPLLAAPAAKRLIGIYTEDEVMDTICPSGEFASRPRGRTISISGRGMIMEGENVEGGVGGPFSGPGRFQGYVLV